MNTQNSAATIAPRAVIATAPTMSSSNRGSSFNGAPLAWDAYATAAVMALSTSWYAPGRSTGLFTNLDSTSGRDSAW